MSNSTLPVPVVGGVINVGRTAIHRGLKAVTDRNLAANDGNYTEVNARLEEVSKFFRTGLQHLDQRVVYLASTKFFTAKNLIHQGLIEVLNDENFDENKIGLNIDYCWKEFPESIQRDFEEVNFRALDTYNDKENCPPLMRIEAMKIILFIKLICFRNNPQACVKFLCKDILSIKKDHALYEAFTELIPREMRFPEGKEVCDAVKGFYNHIQSGICVLARHWGKNVNCQQLVNACNELRFKCDEDLSKAMKFGMNGFVLGDIHQGRLVILVIGNSIKLAKVEKKLIVFNCPHNTLKIDLDSFAVKVFEKTATPLDYLNQDVVKNKFQQQPNQRKPNKESTSNSKLSNESSNSVHETVQPSSANDASMLNVLSNMKQASQCPMIEQLGKMTTEKGKIVSLKADGIAFKWSDGEETYVAYNKFPQKFRSKLNAMMEANLNGKGSENIILLNAQDSKDKDLHHVTVALEMRIAIDQQRIWQFVCSRKHGIQSMEKLNKLSLPANHCLRWCQIEKHFEAVYIDEFDQTKLNFVQLLKNGESKSHIGLFPPCLHEQSQLLHVNEILLFDNVIFVALGVRCVKVK